MRKSQGFAAVLAAAAFATTIATVTVPLSTVTLGTASLHNPSTKGSPAVVATASLHRVAPTSVNNTASLH